MSVKPVVIRGSITQHLLDYQVSNCYVINFSRQYLSLSRIQITRESEGIVGFLALPTLLCTIDTVDTVDAAFLAKDFIFVIFDCNVEELNHLNY